MLYCKHVIPFSASKINRRTFAVTGSRYILWYDWTMTSILICCLWLDVFVYWKSTWKWIVLWCNSKYGHEIVWYILPLKYSVFLRGYERAWHLCNVIFLIDFFEVLLFCYIHETNTSYHNLCRTTLITYKILKLCIRFSLLKMPKKFCTL